MSLGPLKGCWVALEKRDAVVDTVEYFKQSTNLSVRTLVAYFGISPGKYYEWRKRYSTPNGQSPYLKLYSRLLEKETIELFTEINAQIYWDFMPKDQRPPRKRLSKKPFAEQLIKRMQKKYPTNAALQEAVYKQDLILNCRSNLEF